MLETPEPMSVADKVTLTTPAYGSEEHGAPLHAIVVVGAPGSEVVATCPTVSSVVPAGAPPTDPAAATQSKNAIRSASSMWPEAVLHVV